MVNTMVWFILGNVVVLLLALFFINKLFQVKFVNLNFVLEEMKNTLIYNLEKKIIETLQKNRDENRQEIHFLRKEISESLFKFNETVLLQMNNIDLKNEKMRETLASQLNALREENIKKLEEMRKTVDEKLNETLEKRLGESFKQVSERLELVHKGLGEMQGLALGVGDLKKVLTNIKTRGIWGEVQLGNLLEQILTQEQYAKNVATKKGSNDRVEFAVKLPGNEKDNVVWLPIDAKFPQEDYHRLLEAQEKADLIAIEESGKALENRIKTEAKNIMEKYIDVPQTTDFALMFLPTEGLYAEVLRRIGLFETLTQKYKVILTGPTTLAALLNSLQMGFRTLAVEKRSAEVWDLLGAVKTQFGKFGELLDKTSKKLQESSNIIKETSQKSRGIEKKLKKVQELPMEEAIQILGSLEDVEEFIEK